MTTPLQKAAQAVIYRWELPTLLIDNAIEELRKALDAEIAQSVEPVAFMTDDGRVAAERTVNTVMPKAAKDSFCIPLYLHPPQQAAVPSGDRAELILRLAKQWAELDPADPYRADVGQAVSMLEADAQPKSLLRERAQLEQEWCELRNLKQAQQAKQVPMTDEQIQKIYIRAYNIGHHGRDLENAFARTIEAHHGIGGKA